MNSPSRLWNRLICGLLALLLAVVTLSAGEHPPVVARPVTFSQGVKAGFTEMPDSQTGIRLPKPVKRPTAEKPEFVANAGLAAGDYDGDGLCDLFVCSLDGASALFRNLGNWHFTNVTAEAGLDLDGRVLYGATFADVNGDGALDLIVVSLTETNSLFMNDGHGHFTEAKEFPWVHTAQGGNVTAALADIDGDGDLDLYVTGYSQYRYKDVIAPEVYQQMIDSELAKARRGERPDPIFAERFELIPFASGSGVDYRVEERSIPDVLYLNQGGGKFKALMAPATPFRDAKGTPLAPPRDWGLGCAFRDANLDGAPDLYVCNDFTSPDRFWINDGSGHFQPLATSGLRHTSRFSMGVDSADINRDGQPDFFTLDMLSRNHAGRIVQAGTVRSTAVPWGFPDERPQYMQNALYVSRGDGTYAEIAAFSGIKAAGWSWAAVFLDADLDGYEDLLVTTGMERDYMDTDVADRIRQMGSLTRAQQGQTKSLYPPLHTPNLIFRNKHDLTFEDMGTQWGFHRSAVSGGAVTADFDNDGDLDIAINNSDGPLEIYRNDTDASRLAVRLHGRQPNTQGIGARIFVRNGAIPEQSAEVICGGIYASGSDPLRVFACGTSTNHLEIEIRWRSGMTTIVRDVKANHVYEIAEPAPKQSP